MLSSTFSSIIGFIPCSQDFSKVGAITNIVRNKAKEISTMLGGVELVARALRVMEKTTAILVKDVIIIRMDGAKDRIVMTARRLNIRAVAEPVGCPATSSVIDWAKAISAPTNSENAKIREKMNSFLVMGIFPGRDFFCFQQQVLCASEQE